MNRSQKTEDTNINEIFFSEDKYTLFADRYPRIQGIQQVQAWNDQQVVVFDCLSGHPLTT
jgi:hypothetical protein